jgi:TolA-binding protein
MSRQNRHINDKLKQGIRYKTKIGFENDMMTDSDNSALFETIGDYMKGRHDLEDVKNDPSLLVTRDAVEEMMSDYKKNLSVNKEHKKNEKFIREILTCEDSETEMADEIKSIKQEIDNNKLNEITSEWVKEWHAKKQSAGVFDPKSKEISDFITGAINSPVSEPLKSMNEVSKKGFVKSLFVRYTALSAAAVLGAFMLIKSFLPSSDPEKLFSSYYKPFEAISPVTRSINNNLTDNYSLAIESYKTGHYQQAAIGFADELQKDPSAASPQFFLGLSQLALRNYDQAINLLSGAANEQGEYGKEARWYLGLIYLKTTNKQKAAECFGVLAKSDGYYRDRSQEILRRLK